MFTDRNRHIMDSILEAIGQTPLVRLNKIGKGLEGSILAKCEFLNPSGSIKDRMALRMIEDAENCGRIKPGVSTLTEASTGNTAQALAMVAAVKGYRFVVRVPDGISSLEKERPIIRYGGEVETVTMDDPEADRVARSAGIDGTTVEVPGRLKCLREEEQDPRYLWMRQYINPGNANGQGVIGEELLEQTDGKIDVFIASVGTGGTLIGVAEVLKRQIPNIKVIAVIPGGRPPDKDPLSPLKKYIPGISGGLMQQVRDSGIADEIIRLDTEIARAMAYRLSREEGIYCGISSGANVHLAVQEAGKPGMSGKNIVTVIVDRGDRTISNERYVT